MAYFASRSFQRLVKASVSRSGVAAEGHFLAPRLLPVDFGKQQCFSSLGAVDVAGASDSPPGSRPRH
jgi:hypothetical protein